MANNNSSMKKMSLEEFLGNDTLSDTLWDEDDINLDAISSTTNIDLLKKSGGNVGNSNKGSGPPYIVKFSNLPPDFSDFEIKDLFNSKFTNFIKFKLFWVLNSNPTMSDLANPNKFYEYFKLTNKVCFVELYSMRDMDKILKYWYNPLKEIYNIVVATADFDDFKAYMERTELVKSFKVPSADIPLPKHMVQNVPPHTSENQPKERRKSNPFGTAKPVDTQSKILKLEEQISTLHVEDTTTLRRLSNTKDNSNPLLHSNSKHTTKVKILKNENSDHSNLEPSRSFATATITKKESMLPNITPVNDAIPTTKALNYSHIITRETQQADKSKVTNKEANKLNESKSVFDDVEKQEYVQENNGETNGNEGNETNDNETRNVTDDILQATNESEKEICDDGKVNDEMKHQSDSYDYQTEENYKNQREYVNNKGGHKGGSRGGYRNKNYQNNYNNNSSNRPFHKNDKYPGKQNNQQPEERYSMFRPAAGFLNSHNSANNEDSFNRTSKFNNNNTNSKYSSNSGRNDSNYSGSFRGGAKYSNRRFSNSRGSSRGGSFRGGNGSYRGNSGSHRVRFNSSTGQRSEQYENSESTESKTKVSE